MHGEYLVKAATCKTDVGVWAQCSKSSSSITRQNIYICMHCFQSAEPISMQRLSERTWEMNLTWISQSCCPTCSACSACFAQTSTYKGSYMSLSWELCLLGCIACKYYYPARSTRMVIFPPYFLFYFPSSVFCPFSQGKIRNLLSTSPMASFHFPFLSHIFSFSGLW